MQRMERSRRDRQIQPMRVKSCVKEEPLSTTLSMTPERRPYDSTEVKLVWIL